MAEHRKVSAAIVVESEEISYVLKAKYTFSVLDTNGEPVPSYSHGHASTFSRAVSSRCYQDFVKKADLEGSTHLRDDCLTIRCDVTIVKEIHSEEQSRVPPSDLHRHLSDLLNNKDAADVTFQVGGETFAAHRCILAARSSVFKAELLGALQESSPVLIKSVTWNLMCSRLNLLHFLYTDSVPAVLDVVMAGHLLVAADRYNIGRLKLICEEKLCNHIDSSMVATSLALAEQHGFHHLKEACLKFLATPSNLEAMVATSDGYEHLKSSCPSLLKEVISRILPAELKVTKDIIMAMWK